MFDNVISRLPSLSMIDVEFALVDSFDKEQFEAFEKHKVSGTLDYWINTKLSLKEKQQLAKFM